nr:hypothetical protein [uncultured Campylobacter sp.]
MLNLEGQEFRVKGIYDNIEEASSIKQQKIYWLNENNVEGYISSYTELMCTLFDDFNFDDFVKNTACRLGFPPKLIELLQEFRDAIKNYQAKDEADDRVIIEDPNWHIVVEKTRDIIKEWDKYNLGSNDGAFKLNYVAKTKNRILI